MASKSSKDTTPKVTQRRPFLGLRYYEEENKSQFGGRDREIEELYHLVDDNDLTVVFGTSGIGKTSLLKAGLMPKLRMDFYFPIYIRINFGSRKSPLNQLRDRVFKTIQKLDPKTEAIGDRSLWEYLHDVNALNGLITPVLILDQFEELFTIGKKNKGIRDFITELANLAQNRIPAAVKARFKKESKTVPARYSQSRYRVIISLREDYLARLDELKSWIPSIMDVNYRIVKMTPEQAMEAATRPGKDLIEESVARKMVKKILDSSPSDMDMLKDKDESSSGLRIEPWLLSLICHRLNERRISSNLGTITSKLVDDFKVERAMASFYEDTMEDYKDNVAKAIEELLLNSEGHRKLYAKSEFMSKYEVSEEDVISLVDARIIRQENRNKVDYLELIHDQLIPVIKKKRQWRIKEEEKATRQRALEEKLRKRNKQIKRGALIAATIILGIFIWFKADAYNQEKDIWEFVSDTDTEKAYSNYLKKFTNARFRTEAYERLDTLRYKRYHDYWIIAEEENTIESYNQYLSDSKISVSSGEGSNITRDAKYALYVEQAKERLKKLVLELNADKGKDKEAWDIVMSSGNTFQANIKYISSQHRVKNHLKEAVARLDRLGNTGWVFSGRVNQGRTSEEYYKFTSRKNGGSINSKEVPETGDTVENIKGGRKTYSIISSKGNQTGTWRKNNKAYIMRALPDGTALFLQIIFEK